MRFFISFHRELLVDIADSFDLTSSYSTNWVPTRYLDDANNSNSVIDLMFLRPNFSEFNNHTIYLDLWHPSDYTSLTVDIFISEEFIHNKYHTIIKNSKKKDKFTSKLINTIKNINTSQLDNKNSLKLIVQKFAKYPDLIWNKYSKCANITKQSKAWWNKECQTKLVTYRISKQIENWKFFKEIIKKTKKLFFNKKIQKIISNNQRSWDLIN